MKVLIIIISCILTVTSNKVHAQSYEAQQLLLDCEKLSQLKGILKDMKQGYEVVSKGYSTIRDISEGNFSLHQAFLDGLWLVSPAVRKYWKIPQIIKQQLQLITEYKSAFEQDKKSRLLNPEEIVYIDQVYTNLFNQSLQHLDDLTLLLTANKLRMTDDERLSGIDKIYEGMQEKLQFLRSFNSHNSVLLLQRGNAYNEAQVMSHLYDVNK